MKRLWLLHLLVLCDVANAHPDSVELLSMHPWAVQQKSTVGKSIQTLIAWQGKLYAGYGDYGANTGPITLAAFDPELRTFDSQWVANTEAILNFRPIRGRLFAPAIDRKSYAIPGDYSVLDANGVWRDSNCGSTTHAYDIVTLTGNDLWVVGSQDVRATAFRSTDDGATWKPALKDTAITGNPDDFARFYFAGVYNGKLYLQARDFYGSLHPTSHVFDGTNWTQGPDLFPGARGSLGWRPDTFAGRMLYRSWEPGRSTPLRSFNGSEVTWVDSMWVRDVVIENGYCYALVDSGYGTITIERTADLRSWTRIGRVPWECISLAVIAGQYYLGTSDSKILRYVEQPARAGHSRPFSPHVWPNPANEFIDIRSLEGSYPIKLVDVLGRPVTATAERRIDTTTRLSVSHLLSGIYYLTAGVTTIPVVIQR